MEIRDFNVKKFKLTNPVLSAILRSISDEDKLVMFIHFEMNPRLPLSNYKVELKCEREFDLSEITKYAADNCSQLLEKGKSYSKEIMKGNYEHSGFNIDFCFKAPKIIVPHDIMDFDNKGNLEQNLGTVTMKSNLAELKSQTELEEMTEKTNWPTYTIFTLLKSPTSTFTLRLILQKK